METTQLAQMVTWLDEQHRRDRAEITRLQQRVEAQGNEVQEQARRVLDLETRLTNTQSQLGQFKHIEEALDNLKNELKIMVSAQADEISRTHRELERARMSDREVFSRGITEVRKELPRIQNVEEEVAVRKAEDMRLSEIVINLRQDVASVHKEIDERTHGLPYLFEQRNHDNKRIGQLQQENVELFKRVEEMSSKQQMLQQKQQKVESQIVMIPPKVDAITRGQEQFIDSLKLADADRQRQMRDWKQIFESQESTIGDHQQKLKEFAATNEEMHRARADIDQFRVRLERAQGEVAELQRLAEERQRKELSVFQADNEKRWGKKVLEWEFRWEQQDKVNVQVKEQFPKINVRLKHYERMFEFFWRHVETQGSSQLASSQRWLDELQKLADQRSGILKDYEEAQFEQADQ